MKAFSVAENDAPLKMVSFKTQEIVDLVAAQKQASLVSVPELPVESLKESVVGVTSPMKSAMKKK